MLPKNTPPQLAELVGNGLRTGVLAAATTSATAAICGSLENGEPVRPINAVSHIVWGDRATRHTEMSAKHTLTGAALNTTAVTSWAILQELLFGRRNRPATVSEAVVEGATISALAYVTDYYVVPDRLTPGFEKPLSNKSLAAIYGVLALSLGIGALRRR